MKSKAIKVTALTYCYNSHTAVDGITFGVPAGKILGLLGPNGAGKTTTLKMLTTLLPPTLGNACIGGYDIVDHASLVRQQIGYVPQQISADCDMTAYENLLLSARLYGLTGDQRKKRISEVLDFMNLTEFTHQLVSRFSGGMIRRLEIAQALLHEPPVLLLDEPTVGLDPAAKRTVWHHIKELRNQFNLTILMTTHDMEEADALSDLIAFMHLGRIVKLDTPMNLKKEVGKSATLDDVFIQSTGSSIAETGDFNHAKETRRAISHLD